MVLCRLNGSELIKVNEGEEPNDLVCLLGNKESYISMANGKQQTLLNFPLMSLFSPETRFHSYTPRLFELSGTIGEFTANEVLLPARTSEVEAFPFDQSDLYSATQPAIFLVDGFTEVYIWLGWWPRQDNKLLREANATTGSSHSNWLRDKKLACETAQHYIKGAGTCV